MGGGNGQKAKMAREKAQAKMSANRGSQLEVNQKAMNIQCKVCMQTFICTTNEANDRTPRHGYYAGNRLRLFKSILSGYSQH
ncbi:unnamed protein product [Closterium sp. Naga37s-1]|nr:unnamed protein product [Closterium sp. Naga37s-1]